MTGVKEELNLKIGVRVRGMGKSPRHESRGDHTSDSCGVVTYPLLNH